MTDPTPPFCSADGPAALVGPTGGSRCLFRLSREQQAGPDWGRSVPLPQGVLLRARSTAERRAEVYRQLTVGGGRVRAGAVADITDTGTWTDLPGTGASADQERRTRSALAAGAQLIWGAALPADPAAGREGMRCGLLKIADGDYAPILVVNHKVVDPRSSVSREQNAVWVTGLEQWDPVHVPGFRARRHPEDLGRLAHAWRLLETLGYARETPRGAVVGLGLGGVGLDELGAGEPGHGGSGLDGLGPQALVVDLERRLGVADQAHSRRLEVARGRISAAPRRIAECRICPWWEGWSVSAGPGGGAAGGLTDGPAGRTETRLGCRELLEDADDVSLVVVSGQVDRLRAMGLSTVSELADYCGPRPESWHGEPFADAVLRAKAWRAGVVLVPKVARPQIPRADIEVDVDLESHFEDGAYLWGTLLAVRDGGAVPGGGATGYRPFVTWAPLPGPEEGRNFADFWQWLTRIRLAAQEECRSFIAYCFSKAAENSWMLATATRFGPEGTEGVIPGVPGVREVQCFVSSPQWVDVHEAVAAQCVSTAGMGLKVVAPVTGFLWRDPEAGGEASIEWYRYQAAEAGGKTGKDLSARGRILRYNEDDVRATRSVREWLSAAK